MGTTGRSRDPRLRFARTCACSRRQQTVHPRKTPRSRAFRCAAKTKSKICGSTNRSRRSNRPVRAWKQVVPLGKALAPSAAQQETIREASQVKPISQRAKSRLAGGPSPSFAIAPCLPPLISPYSTTARFRNPDSRSRTLQFEVQSAQSTVSRLGVSAQNEPEHGRPCRKTPQFKRSTRAAASPAEGRREWSWRIY